MKKKSLQDRILRSILLGILLVVAGAGVLYRALDIDLLNHLPTVSVCPFHTVTGLPCPGCGMIRAFLSLGQLKFVQAVQFNPLAVPLLALMFFYLCGGRFPFRIVHWGIPAGLLLTGVLVFGLLRMFAA
jgi:hypothetical protein